MFLLLVNKFLFLRRHMQTIDKKMTSEIIETNINKISGAILLNKNGNKGFVVQISTGTIRDFEKQFQKNLSTTVNEYIEKNLKLNSKNFNRSIIYSISVGEKNKVIINI